MSNAWNITAEEYKMALCLLRKKETAHQGWDDIYHFCRLYRGQVFIRDAAERGAHLVRDALRTSERTR